MAKLRFSNETAKGFTSFFIASVQKVHNAFSYGFLQSPQSKPSIWRTLLVFTYFDTTKHFVKNLKQE